MNLHNQLRQSGDVKPRRPLHPQFTQTIIEHLDAHPRPAHLSERIKEYLKMKFAKTPMRLAASIAGLALIGGTSYAAVTNWPVISATFGSEQTLPNGNRIVTVDLSNCPVTDDNGVHMQDGKRTISYEVSHGDSLSNDQVVAEVQASCEEKASAAQQAVITTAYTALTGKSNFDGGGTLMVESVDSHQVAGTIDSKYGRGVIKQTYSHIAPDVIVYEGTQKATLDAIKPGDIVDVITVSNISPAQAEAQDPSRQNTDNYTIVGLVKHPDISQNVTAFYKHSGRDYVPVHADNSAPGGFARNYEFDIQ